jgi:hypothetical protein
MRAVLPTAAILLVGAILAGCNNTWHGMFWFSKKTPSCETVLSAGLPGLEIEGADVDGRHLRLSDYRGQVVMLDFWGNW